mgnify:CR=1 FL=1
MHVWGEYDRWNQELASRHFGRHREGLPTYLEPEEDLLRECADAIGVTGSPLEALVAAVAPTLEIETGRGPALDRHWARFQTWRRSLRVPEAGSTSIDTPPVVALLVVLVAAAKLMGSDSTQAAHAYYPRLNALFGLDALESTRLKEAFHRTETFWRGINEYLELHEGLIGLPTAYALGHRYVGLPQSQALVRGGDRGKLPDFFQKFGLAPGSELVPSDLDRLLDAWITTSPSPVSANLQNLWKRGSARERVAGIAAVELAHWDGRGRAGSVGPEVTSGLRLTLVLRKTFGGRTAELSFVDNASRDSEAETLRVTSADGQPEVGVVPAPGGRLRPTPGSKLDPESLVGALVTVLDPTTDIEVTRRPRRVFVMRRDELIGAWTEVDRVHLMEDFVVFVKNDQSLVTKVLDLVNTYGDMAGERGGPSDPQRPAMRGLPDGWVMLEDVRLHSVPQDAKHLDLQPLLPLSTAQMSFARGLKLPGHIRKWLSSEPPELRAAVADARSMTVKVWQLGEARELLDEWTETAQALVKPISELELEDGDYELELYANGETAPISASTLRLRSGDTPDVMTWETCARLNYELDTAATSALSAVAASEDSEVLVDGVNTIASSSGPQRRLTVAARPSWTNHSRDKKHTLAPIVLGKADPNSCMVTGAHRTQLPPFMGKATTAVIGGVCTICGLQKTFPARPRRKKVTPTANQVERELVVVAPKARPSDVSWDSCLDALVHVGGGSLSMLERIATQAEGSSLFVDEFVRTLEVLGHIDVRRDEDLQPVEWEANPAYLAETEDGLVLAGIWSAQSRRDLAAVAGVAGGSLERMEADAGTVSSWFLRGLSAHEAEALATSLEDVYVVPDAARRMVNALPTLGELEQALPLLTIPQYRSAELFDVRSASWLGTPGVAGPGAYRLNQSFRKIPVWIDEEGARSREARLSTVHLVKHQAARAAGSPLTAYLTSTRTFLVPLGAELPALYGRALTLCSGKPPVVSPRQGVVAYRTVPQDVAEQMQHLLSA